MNNHFVQEIIIAVILGILLIFFLDPFMLLMSDMLLMVVTGGLLVVWSTFAVFLWREKPHDEREGLHRMVADRVAFLAGSATLVLAIVVQTLRHEGAGWFVIALGVMVIAKVAGLIWARIRL